MQNEKTPAAGPLNADEIAAGWLVWSGGETAPIPGLVDLKFRDGEIIEGENARKHDWLHSPRRNAPEDIIAYRPHAPVSRPGDGVVGESRGIRRAKPGWLKRSLDEVQAEKGPGGWLVNSADGVWEWTGVKIAAVAALTEGLPVWSISRGGYEPTAEPVSRPAGEGEREAVALSDLRTIHAWLIGLSTNPDLNDVVADGGVTVGMCYQQEAREFAGRIDRALCLLRPASRGEALTDIAVERQRQIEVHGWSLDHDDCHDRGEIANAAADYASTGQQPISTSWACGSKVIDKEPRRQQLVKAGALIVAEIERLDRAALQPGGER